MQMNNNSLWDIDDVGISYVTRKSNMIVRHWI